MYVLRWVVQYFCCQFRYYSIQISINIRIVRMNDKGVVRFQFDYVVSLIDIRDIRFLYDNGDVAIDVLVIILRFR